MTLPPSATLKLQRILNERESGGLCAESVMSGLLVAMYVEPFAPGQVGDGGVLGVGVIVAMLTDCVTVAGALLIIVLVVGALLVDT